MKKLYEILSIRFLPFICAFLAMGPVNRMSYTILAVCLMSAAVIFILKNHNLRPSMVRQLHLINIGLMLTFCITVLSSTS